MASGSLPALKRIDELRSRWALDTHGLWSVRAELLSQLGRHKEAKSDFERAAHLTLSHLECGVMLARAAQCAALIQKRPILRLVK
jgi:predicted RNA polymerase sigma factor